jgi:transposase
MTGTRLTEVYGVGPVIASTLIGEIVDVRRYRSRHAFASANGTAPIPASSGRTSRHRLYRRKLAEGKTDREALRCLKRRLSDLIYKTLHNDVATLLAEPKAPKPGGSRLRTMGEATAAGRV